MAVGLGFAEPGGEGVMARYSVDYFSGERLFGKQKQEDRTVSTASSERAPRPKDGPAVMGIIFWVALAFVAVIILVLTFPGIS
jgi:hypothetical protein